MDYLRKQHIEANVYFILDRLKHVEIEECPGLDYNKCNAYLSKMVDVNLTCAIHALIENVVHVKTADVVAKITQMLPYVLQNIGKFMVLLDSDTVGIDFYILSKIYDDLRNHPNFEGIFFTRSVEPRSPEILILGDIDISGKSFDRGWGENYIKSVNIWHQSLDNANLHIMIPYITDETIDEIDGYAHNGYTPSGTLYNRGIAYQFYFKPVLKDADNLLINLQEVQSNDWNMSFNRFYPNGLYRRTPVYTDYYVPCNEQSFPEIYLCGEGDFDHGEIPHGSLFIRDPSCKVFADMENLLTRFMRRHQMDDDDQEPKWKRKR